MSAPSSTYRLQLSREFPFARVEDLVPYLKALGVGAVYLSPILLARPGSTHGYDICDHNRINPDLGGEEGFEALSRSLRAADMGCILDFVPNHMGADPLTNPWWWDVLENGPSSPFGRYFDIDWEPVKPDLRGKVLLPVLGDQYGRVLERGELRLDFAHGALVVCYHEHRFPINPRMAPMVLGYGVEQGRLPGQESQPHTIEFLSILTALRNLPAYFETDAAKIRERQREKEVARRRLAVLTEESAPVRTFIDGNLAAFNGTPGDTRSFDLLHALLESQAYRLAYWRTAGHEINYRRFFDINGLLAIRVELPEVREATHGLLLELIRSGRATGVRLDHVDGLYDPTGYLEALRAMTAASTGDGASAKPVSGPGDDIYIVVEKILCGDERLRADWPVDGTTGYEFLNDLNGLFVDRTGMTRLRRLYTRFTGRDEAFARESRECKRLILDTSMGSELNVLANLLDRLSETDRTSRDFTLDTLRDVLRETIASFPNYRTYGRREGFALEDVDTVDTALLDAMRENPAMETSSFAFLRSMLLPFEPASERPPGSSLSREARLDFAMKFQQLTGPVQAKGVEDTAFYRDGALLSLCEVGGDPSSTGRDITAFHRRLDERHRAFPCGIATTATHDTKRGEDARARLNALTEMPDLWRRVVLRLARLMAPFRASRAAEIPTRNDEYILYQSLVGCWPLAADGKPVAADAELVARVRRFLLKAAREAKLQTSWINQNLEYERALADFLDTLLGERMRSRFQRIFFPFLTACARPGAANSLAQVVARCSAPGVPDVYQGTELWDLSLVDPDNRRPVDYTRRARSLESMQIYLDPAANPPRRSELARELLAAWPDGRVKQYLLGRCLRWRAQHPALFLEGMYRPLEFDSGDSSPWIAWSREHGDEALVNCFCTRAAEVSRALGSGDDRQPPRAPVSGDALQVPVGWAGRDVVHLFTGARHTLRRDGARCRVPFEWLTAEFPVAWLWLASPGFGSGA